MESRAHASNVPPRGQRAVAAAPDAAASVPPPWFLASALGNRVFSSLIAARAGQVSTSAPAPAPPVPAYAAAEPPAASDWEASGNLHGDPPVRSRHRVPSAAVVEDQADYQALRDAVTAALTHQRERADRLRDAQTGTI